MGARENNIMRKLIGRHKSRKGCRNGEAGFGFMEIAVFLGVVSVVFIIFFFTVDFIIGVRQRRVEDDWKRLHARNKKTLNTMERGPGGFQADCPRMFAWRCTARN